MPPQVVNPDSTIHDIFSLVQHRGFCFGSHMAQDDHFEIRLPAEKKESAFQRRNSVQVKCEIYEPQVLAPTTL